MPAAAMFVPDLSSATSGERRGASNRAGPSLAAPERYSLAVGYLRASLVILVVAHHAVLAYHPFAPASPAPLPQQPQWWQVFPVVDSRRWSGFAALVAFNDTFLMSLFFLLSGLFVCSSLRRKGPSRFARDRALRLGVPFLVGAAVLAPLAYYPSYLQSAAAPSVRGFWSAWRQVGTWPAGPVWFIWMLLAFDLGAAVLSRWTPRGGHALQRGASRLGGHPLVWFTLLVWTSAVVYVPAVMAAGPLHWTSVGPFAFQTSRVGLYGLYFTTGAVLGAGGGWRGLLAPGGALARNWLRWSAAALFAFGVFAILTIASVSQPAPARILAAAVGLTFTISCAASSFAALALFLRWVGRRYSLAESLRGSSYGIYQLHYVAVTWLQFALLGVAWPGAVKGTAVFLCASASSWAIVVLCRRVGRLNPLPARVTGDGDFADASGRS